MSKSEICMWLGLWGYKSLGVLLLGFPFQRQELGLLCYCTMNKLSHGMIHLRLRPGEPGVDPIRKPDLCEGRQVGHLWAHWNCRWKGALVPALKVSGLGNVTESLVSGQTGMFP